MIWRGIVGTQGLDADPFPVLHSSVGPSTYLGNPGPCGAHRMINMQQASFHFVVLQ